MKSSRECVGFRLFPAALVVLGCLGAISMTSRATAAESSETLSGVVRDENGKPIAETWVALVSRELLVEPDKPTRQFRDPSVTATDIAGRFSFPPVLPGTSDLLFQRSGYRTVRLRSVAVPNGAVQVSLGRPMPFYQTGQVLDGNGTPVPEAEVILLVEQDESSETEPRVYTTTSGTDGRFRFPELFNSDRPPRRVTNHLFVRKAGYGFWGRDVDATGGETDVLAVLGGTGTLRGTVSDADGRPLAGAQMAVRWIKYDYVPRQPLSMNRPFVYGCEDYAPGARTDDNGHFVVAGLPSGAAVMLRVSCPGYACREIQNLLTDTEALAIELQRGGTVRGVVVYQTTGRPAANVRLYATVETNEVVYNRQPRRSFASCVSDGEGRFELRDSLPGTCGACVVTAHLGAAAPGEPAEWTADRLLVEDLKAGEIREGLKVVLTKGAIVWGKVTDARGAPIEGTSVGVYTGPYDGRNPHRNAVLHTAELTNEGTYVCRVPPGEQYVYVMHFSYGGGAWNPRNTRFRLTYGEVRQDVDFVLSVAPPE